MNEKSKLRRGLLPVRPKTAPEDTNIFEGLWRHLGDFGRHLGPAGRQGGSKMY